MGAGLPALPRAVLALSAPKACAATCSIKLRGSNTSVVSVLRGVPRRPPRVLGTCQREEVGGLPQTTGGLILSSPDSEVGLCWWLPLPAGPFPPLRTGETQPLQGNPLSSPVLELLPPSSPTLPGLSCWAQRPLSPVPPLLHPHQLHRRSARFLSFLNSRPPPGLHPGLSVPSWFRLECWLVSLLP